MEVLVLANLFPYYKLFILNYAGTFKFLGSAAEFPVLTGNLLFSP